jgi:hypothetical protein
MLGGKVLTPPALVCGSVAVLSALIGPLLSAVERADGHHTAGLLLVVRTPSLLTPCASEMQLSTAASHRRRQCKLALRSKAGVPLGIRRAVPGEKAGLSLSHIISSALWKERQASLSISTITLE